MSRDLCGHLEVERLLRREVIEQMLINRRLSGPPQSEQQDLCTNHTVRVSIHWRGRHQAGGRRAPVSV